MSFILIFTHSNLKILIGSYLYLRISHITVGAWVSKSAVWIFCGSAVWWRSWARQIWRVFWCHGICRCTTSPQAFYH